MIRPVLPVVTAVLTVVTAFAASLWYSLFLVEPINDRALTIIRDAVPSIRHLSSIRYELNRLDEVMSKYVTEQPQGADTSNEIDAIESRMRNELEAYRALPISPEEAAPLEQVRENLATIDRLTDQMVSRANAGAIPEAARTLHDVFHASLSQADHSIERLQAVSEEQVARSATRIMQMRRNATVVAIVLGSASLLLAFVVTVLVLHVLQIRSALIRERTELLASRTTELDAFAGRVAHDLKDPLSAVALQVQWLARLPDLEGKARRQLEKTSRQVRQMSGLIDGLLEFARAGAKPARGARVDLGATLDDVVSNLEPKAAAVETRLTLESFAPLRLACTPAALSSVLSNLIGNAIKYIVEGEQRPRIITVRVVERGDVARVEITDNGPGLRPDALGSIFEPFYRSKETRQSGTGLGLATAKRIVDAYQGRIGVESKLRKGSTFWFEIPKATEDVAELSDGPAAAP